MYRFCITLYSIFQVFFFYPYVKCAPISVLQAPSLPFSVHKHIHIPSLLTLPPLENITLSWSLLYDFLKYLCQGGGGSLWYVYYNLATWIRAHQQRNSIIYLQTQAEYLIFKMTITHLPILQFMTKRGLCIHTRIQEINSFANEYSL